MSTGAARRSLDESVSSALERLRSRGAAAPEVLCLMATGASRFAARLSARTEFELGELAPAAPPAPWDAQVLTVARLGPLTAWCLDDVSDETVSDGAGPPPPDWVRGFPVWLAAAAGASVCLHTSAGSALSPDGGGRLALVRDHLNLSGGTPLLGLGPSRLGPLFPDLSRLHDGGLRRAALARCEALGLPAFEAVAACTAGPALETPAERAMLARLGAEIAVQSLAAPLLAAGHAGLALLAIVAVTGSGPGQIGRLLESARSLQPALEELLLALGDDLASLVQALRSEGVR